MTKDLNVKVSVILKNLCGKQKITLKNVNEI